MKRTGRCVYIVSGEWDYLWKQEALQRKTQLTNKWNLTNVVSYHTSVYLVETGYASDTST